MQDQIFKKILNERLCYLKGILQLLIFSVQCPYESITLTYIRDFWNKVNQRKNFYTVMQNNLFIETDIKKVAPAYLNEKSVYITHKLKEEYLTHMIINLYLEFNKDQNHLEIGKFLFREFQENRYCGAMV